MDIKGKRGRAAGGSCYTCVPLHSKEIAYLRGSVEDVLWFPWVDILEWHWLCEQVDGISPVRPSGVPCTFVTFKVQRRAERLKVIDVCL